LCDRYLDSSLAYQGGARGIGIDKVLDINMFATEGTFPDMTLLFDIKPEIGLARIAANAGREVNRLDLEKMSFHEGVRKTFLELAKRYPERYVVIDASKSPEEVLRDAMDAILAKLGK
jgi:dTMP kinase